MSLFTRMTDAAHRLFNPMKATDISHITDQSDLAGFNLVSAQSTGMNGWGKHFGKTAVAHLHVELAREYGRRINIDSLGDGHMQVINPKTGRVLFVVRTSRLIRYHGLVKVETIDGIVAWFPYDEKDNLRTYCKQLLKAVGN